MIREAAATDLADILAVINDGALVYRGVIPADRWHEPYMSEQELQSEIEAGVEFSCSIDGGQIVGVMGIQDMGPVVLIRHAYVRTSARRQGLGAELLASLTQKVKKPILIGTWKAASWAMHFYEKHGFKVLPEAQAAALLGTYWDIPARQVETSVVLADSRYAMENHPVLESVLTCPHCRATAVETMPTDACIYFYECPGCHALLKPKPGDCCVFCSYGSVKCPPVQLQRSGCCSRTESLAS